MAMERPALRMAEGRLDGVEETEGLRRGAVWQGRLRVVDGRGAPARAVGQSPPMPFGMHLARRTDGQGHAKQPSSEASVEHLRYTRPPGALLAVPPSPRSPPSMSSAPLPSSLPMRADRVMRARAAR